MGHTSQRATLLTLAASFVYVFVRGPSPFSQPSSYEQQCPTRKAISSRTKHMRCVIARMPRTVLEVEPRRATRTCIFQPELALSRIHTTCRKCHTSVIAVVVALLSINVSHTNQHIRDDLNIKHNPRVRATRASAGTVLCGNMLYSFVRSFAIERERETRCHTRKHDVTEYYIILYSVREYYVLCHCAEEQISIKPRRGCQSVSHGTTGNGRLCRESLSSLEGTKSKVCAGNLTIPSSDPAQSLPDTRDILVSSLPVPRGPLDFRWKRPRP